MGSFSYVIRVFVVRRLTVRREYFFSVSALLAALWAVQDSAIGKEVIQPRNVIAYRGRRDKGRLGRRPMSHNCGPFLGNDHSFSIALLGMVRFICAK